MWSARLQLRSLRGIPASRQLSTLRGKNSHRGPRGSIVRPTPIQPIRQGADIPQTPEATNADPQPEHQPQDAYNANYDPAQNTLLSPVHIPEDPNGVLKETHPATNILANSGVVVQRQLEMMNIMM
jgi:hypothetical protein